VALHRLLAHELVKDAVHILQTVVVVHAAANAADIVLERIELAVVRATESSGTESSAIEALVTVLGEKVLVDASAHARQLALTFRLEQRLQVPQLLALELDAHGTAAQLRAVQSVVGELSLGFERELDEAVVAPALAALHDAAEGSEQLEQVALFQRGVQVADE